MKIHYYIMLILFFFPYPLCAENNKDSIFIKHILKYAIYIEIPRHWEIIQNKIMEQIDTNTEALTGSPQGNNEILLAANYYTSDLKKATATVRLSVRHKETISQYQLSKMGKNDIEIESMVSRYSLESMLKKSNSGMLLTAFDMKRKKFESFLCFETEYILNYNEKQILYIIPKENMSIKVHFSYLLKNENLIKPTTNYIINSIFIGDI